MKKNYLILFVILIASNLPLFAQFGAQPDEGGIPSDPGGEGGGWTFSCECIYPSTFNDIWFYYSQIAKAERDSWLRHQENNLKEEIENRLNRNFENFRDAQFNLFKDYRTVQEADQTIQRYRQNLQNGMDKLSFDLQKTNAKYQLLKLRKADLIRISRGLPALYDFNDITYNNKRIMSLDYAEINHQEYLSGEDYFFKFSKFEALYVRDNRADIVGLNGLLADNISNRMVKHYNKVGDYEDRIRLMTGYMVDHFYPLPSPVTNIINNAYGYYNYDSVLDGMARNNDLPYKFYKEEIVSPSEIKLTYVVNDMGENASAFINQNADLKSELRDYLEHSNFNGSSIAKSKELFQSYIDGTMEFGYPFTQHQSFEGHEYDRPERYAILRLYQQSASSGYRGYSDLLEEFSLAATDYASEGKGIRSLIKAGGKTIPSDLTDKMLGKLFDFYGSGDFYMINLSPYGKANIEDWDRGPYGWKWLEDPFYIDGLKVVANGGRMDFYNKIILGKDFQNNPCLNGVYNSLNTSVIAKDYLNKFNIAKPVANLKFTLGVDNTYPTANAVTYNPVNYVIEIKFNPNNLKRPKTSIARTFIHEIIHAEMYRKLLSLAKDSSIPWSENFINSIKNDFPGLNDYYTRWYYNVPNGQYPSDPQHQLMAEHYRKTITDFLIQFDTAVTTRQAKDLAWEGLMGSGIINNITGLPSQPTEAWKKIEKTERLRILASNKKFNSSNQNCK